MDQTKMVSADVELRINNTRIELALMKSEVDGAPVLYIDTPDIAEDARGPILRVYLNDGVIYENPSLETDGES